MTTDRERDLAAHFEMLDRWCSGEDGDETPLDVLRKRGIELASPEAVSDDAIGAELWRTIEALAGIGVFLESTDHLSDRELYQHLWTDLLQDKSLIITGSGLGGGWFHSPIGGWSNEDMQVWLRYYADEDERRLWQKDSPDESLPPREKPLADRDRLLPGPQPPGSQSPQ